MKKIFSKISLLFALIFIVSLALVGCKPKGNPQEVLNTHYQMIKDNNIEKAYDTLCEESKKDFKKEDFIKWRNTEKEVYKLKDVNVEKVKEFKGSLEDIEFKNVVEFNVTEKGKDIYENEESKLTYKRYVVNDNGKWKIYFGKNRGNQLASISLNQLARMYMYGSKNKRKDLDKATSLLEEAIKLDPNNKKAKSNLKVVPQFKAVDSIKKK